MTIDTDFHSHVSRSSAMQMVESAREKGLRILGLSEHDFQMQEARSLLEHMPLEGVILPFAGYIEGVRMAGQQANFDVRLGMEVDFLPHKNGEIQATIGDYDWDFLIGSVHEIDGLLFERHRHMGQEVGQELWRRYFSLLRDAVNSGYFSLVSHPVRMRVGNPHLPPDFDEELERLAREAARSNVALELNGYDVLTYPSLVRRLAKACAAQGTPVSVGSDAHKPREIAQAHKLTEEIMREAGLSRVRIWKRHVPEEYRI
ncbi:MAG TPA: PHP domain-containing protein [Ktedonobacteraceae bacterium]|jgi:histidinol-phosphatase (PHP family)|nr:PHP domain-containing protein [Ktedonobacteraceae bacterium]